MPTTKANSKRPATPGRTVRPAVRPTRTTYSSRIVFYDTPQTKKRLEQEAKRADKNFSDYMRERERRLHRLGAYGVLRNQ